MQTHTGIHVLASRSGDGLTITLSYDFDSDTCRVEVRDAAGEDFTLYPHNAYALDCYRHPYAYAEAALNGLSRPRFTACLGDTIPAGWPA